MTELLAAKGTSMKVWRSCESKRCTFKVLEQKRFDLTSHSSTSRRLEASAVSNGQTFLQPRAGRQRCRSFLRSDWPRHHFEMTSSNLGEFYQVATRTRRSVISRDDMLHTRPNMATQSSPDSRQRQTISNALAARIVWLL